MEFLACQSKNVNLNCTIVQDHFTTFLSFYFVGFLIVVVCLFCAGFFPQLLLFPHEVNTENIEQYYIMILSMCIGVE